MRLRNLSNKVLILGVVRVPKRRVAPVSKALLDEYWDKLEGLVKAGEVVIEYFPFEAVYQPPNEIQKDIPKQSEEAMPTSEVPEVKDPEVIEESPQSLEEVSTEEPSEGDEKTQEVLAQDLETLKATKTELQKRIRSLKAKLKKAEGAVAEDLQTNLEKAQEDLVAVKESIKETTEILKDLKAG